MAAVFATFFMIIITVIGSLLYHWYLCSFKPYIFNKGLKFTLPPYSEYPFTHRWLSLTTFDHVIHPNNTTDPCLHFIDEQPSLPTNQIHRKHNITFLFLHGNPTWSFMYRKIIKKVRERYRCVALDYPGFGLSTAPKKYGFTVREHAEIVLKLINKLDLSNIILVQQDWGGPIGFGIASNLKVIHDRKIIGFVVGNTWSSPFGYRLDALFFSNFYGGFFGRSLGYGMNLVVDHFWYFGFWKKVDDAVLKWYNIPFVHPQSRCGSWIFPKEGFAAENLLETIKREIPKEYGMKNIPMLLTWGMRDHLFGKQELNMFRSWFKDREIVYLDESGHFWPEDEGNDAAEDILDWAARKF